MEVGRLRRLVPLEAVARQQPDDIIDNHFGLAGGTVTVRDGEEFETDGCGTWQFIS
jgi:hypothetical protein